MTEIDQVSEKTPLVDYEEEELTGCGGSLPCNPRRPLHRYLILIIMCFLSFGSYFCYDNPAALQDDMIRDLHISVSEFMGFYSWYSWPNVILCFFGGFLIDRVFGVRLGAIIFSVFVTIGQVIFALGSFLNKYWLMCVGRFIFGVQMAMLGCQLLPIWKELDTKHGHLNARGIGGESLAVAQNTYAVKWFQGRELNMVFGLQLSFSRVGSTVNMNVMQPIYNFISKSATGYTCLGIALFVGGGMCLLSLVCALALAFFDKRADRILKREKTASDEVIRFRDVKDFSVPFWLLCVICVAYYVAVFPFIGLGLVFFEMKWHMDPTVANSVNSLVYIISAGASPIFGFFIDKTGKNIFWVILGTLVTIGCHALLAFTFITPYVAMSIMGLAYSVLASALWPMASMVVAQHQLGTAYGIMQAIQNLGLATIAIAAGSIVDKNGYLILEVFFLAWLCLALIAAVLLYLVDAAQGGRLNRSAGDRRREEAEALEKEAIIN